MIEDTTKERSLLLDFGKNFGEENKFFDEFLKPRDRFGVYDLLRMGLLPPFVHLYRKDLIPPDFDFSMEVPKIKPVGGLLITHAHLDHIGYIPYLSEDLPMVASTVSAALMKSLQDTNRQLYSELVAVAGKETTENGVIKSSSTASLRARPFLLMQSPQDRDAFTEHVWSTCFTKKSYMASAPWYGSDTCSVAEFNVRSWPVDHSIPGAMAYAVETSAGWVVYTGDLRLHGTKGALTRAFFKEAAALNPVALITEGTHPEEINPVTEQQVEERSLNTVKNNAGLTIADFGARNVERLLSFLRIAKETNKYLVLTPKDFLLLEYLNYATEDVPHPLDEPCVLVYISPKSRNDGWETHVISLLSPEKMVNSKQIHARPEDYILCFSYYDFANLLDIDVHNGCYIYSSSEPFNEEMALDHEKIKNWINLFGFEIYGRLGQVAEAFDNRDPFHASGHIDANGLKEMIETIKPKYLIPIHTEKPQFFEQFKGMVTLINPKRYDPIVL